MAIRKMNRATIILPDGSSIEQNTVPKTPGDVNGGEHIVRQDVQNGYGVVLEAANNAVSIDRNLFYNKAEIGMIEANITEAYKTEVVDKITQYETKHVKKVYATKEEVENLQNEAMSNYTLKTVTNQVWTTSVTTFATKKELDEIAKKYGIGIVIMGSVSSHTEFTTNPIYSADNPKRFQGETYFTKDLHHLWQFNLTNAVVSGPQIMIDKPNGFKVNETIKDVPFQLWLGREHADPDAEITVKFGISDAAAIKITLPGSDSAITEITAPASSFAPQNAGTIKLSLKSISDSVDPSEEFVTFTAYNAEGAPIPQILALTSPVYFNGYIPATLSVAQRSIAKQNTRTEYKISSTAASTYTQNTRAVLPGDELIGTEIVGTYGKWVNIGSIVGPPNELVREVLVDTIQRQYVTVAGSQPITTKVESTAEVLSEYPTQQLSLGIVEGVQGAPGVRGYVGNKITPAIAAEDNASLGRKVQMLSWAEYDWENTPIEDALGDPNNPNTVYPNLPTKVRIEGLDSYEVWKDYYTTQGAEESSLTKDNYFLDITGDSAFKFWKDYIKGTTTATFEEWLATIPGFGDWFVKKDVEDYLAYQKGDAYIPVYNEATGVVSYKYFDSYLSPETDPDHDEALGGWRVRGQVFEPTVNFNSGEISFTRRNEESTSPTIAGVNIRGNVWVPSIDTDTGELSWANTRDTNNPADVTPTYIYGPIYEPVLTYSTVERDWDAGTGFQSYTDEIETLTWKSVRKPTSLQTATNIKGLKGSPVKVQLNLVNDVTKYDQFNVTISQPEYTATPDHIGYNTQTLSVFTPFDKYNLKVHDSAGVAWYVGVDLEGRLVTSNTPFEQKEAGAFAAAAKMKMDSMRKQIEELKATINLMKED